MKDKQIVNILEQCLKKLEVHTKAAASHPFIIESLQKLQKNPKDLELRYKLAEY